MKTIYDSLHVPKPESLAARRAIAGSVLAFGALLGMGAKHVVDTSGHEFTQQQLHNMPQKEVTVKPGEGAHDEILKVDPKLINDGQGWADVSQYVQKQGILPNHQLDQGQAVSVPVLPEQGK